MQRRLVDEGSQQEKEEVERQARGFVGGAVSRGELSRTPFPELLAQLYRWRASGALLLRRDKVKKIVSLKDGYPVTVKSNLLSECLGQIMVRERMISQPDCDLSIEKMKETKRQQGTLLIEMGIISPHNLHFALQRQLETKLFDIFSWREGDYQFNPKGEVPETAVQLEHPPAVLILEGVKRGFTPERLRLALAGRMGEVLRVHPDPLQQLQDLELTETERRLVSLVDGQRTVKQVLEESPLSPATGLTLVYGLIAAQVLQCSSDEPEAEPTLPMPPAAAAGAESSRSAPPPLPGPRKATQPALAAVPALPVPPPPTPPPTAAAPRASATPDRDRAEGLARRVKEMRKMNYFEMLGISKNASQEEVRRAYFSQAKDFHPDKHFGTSPEVKALADQVYSMLSTAYEVLCDPRDREDYVRGLHTAQKSGVSDEVGRILAAEARFQKGEAAMRKKDWPRALEAFQEAVELFREEGEFHCYLGWARYQAATADPAQVSEAEKDLAEGLRLNPRFDRGYLFLGWVYKSTGRKEAAEAQFERAIQVNPDCVEALRELRLLGEHRGRRGM